MALSGNRRYRCIVTLAVLLAAGSLFALGAASATHAEEAAASAPVVFRRTRVETRPAATEASLSMERRAHEGLEERQGGTAAGGVIVDLQGRLGSLLTAGSGGDGMPDVGCVEHPPLSVTP